jgi:type I restriction enzyme R subunit
VVRPIWHRLNKKVRDLIAEAIKSDGVEEIFKIGEDQSQIDLFDADYLAKIEKIQLPNTKIRILQMLLAKAIDQVKKVNKVQGIDFTKRFNAVVEKYNERKESDVLRGEVLEDFSNELIDLFSDLKTEKGAFEGMGISFEEKSFYDILKSLAKKYQFEYPDKRLIELAKKVKDVVDDTSKYTDWNRRNDIRDELRVALILLLAEYDYPPAANDEVYKQIFEQAQNFKSNR